MKDVDGAAFRQLQELRDELRLVAGFMRQVSYEANNIPEDVKTFRLLGKSEGYWYGKAKAFSEAADWVEELL